ncbi:hypothetical protein HII17_15985 [Thalassotalea sp. M1531]|uniref:asparagine synthase (glutamine-hydrolyzing) n=1 Tax=Thalassotalea algicola TaxID=2716224 RepID=A0A7Y0LEH6_9GAMM|nr:asparagine synthase-related protein [Thalassotalea algicola]NMP33058.1 hypothetical protein [Thalassotalea algicola]
MTVFAGIIKKDGNTIGDEESLEFKACLERVSKKVISFEFKEGSKYLLTINFSKEKNYLTGQNGCTSIVSGAPILTSSNSLYDALSELNCVNSRDELENTLGLARGVFSGVSIDRKNSKTYVYTDKLGVRPVYYYDFNGHIIFSSLLSFLEELPTANLAIDESGVAELVSFGYCLSNRTQYRYIKRLDAGQYLDITDDYEDVLVNNYWDYSSIPVKESLQDIDVKELYEIFIEAIKVRIDADKPAVAFLSGGLDSRALTSCLSKYTKDISTFNFGTQKSQDNDYAKQYAIKARFNHHEIILPKLKFPNWSKLISESLDEKTDSKFNNLHKVVWSGDGGSVSLGGVYIDDKLIKSLKNRDEKESISSFLSQLNGAFPEKLFQKRQLRRFKGKVEIGTRNELQSYPQDTTKAIYHFLMRNDQKRHLELHFETICQHEVELELPFFDSVFIEKLYSLPAKELMYHKLYMDWFKNCPEFSRLTPWQTYPGHIPCPIESKTELSYQWDNGPINKAELKEIFSDYLSLLNSTAFDYIDKAKSFFFMGAHRLGLGNYSYIMNVINRLNKIKNK